MEYDKIREQFKPKHIRILLIAESPPPSADTPSSRHFYRADAVRRDDRLFINTVRAVYPDAADTSEAELEKDKQEWLKKLQHDGFYMIEALEATQPHEATKVQRQNRIRAALPYLLHRVSKLAGKDTKIILIKSNVFDVAADPLKAAGFSVLNKKLLDYPGRFNQRAYREKLAALLKEAELS